ncbi:hypothetical protein BT96DRAFT_946801 [Gymnopus androsaceus JB14]|uniref:Uncharacterized protein n=1 Tax=Gymnopus androsaceus JB14 TaxID=1447944 RepID=A0A6A4GWR7_9AGAR|nr:hypothetical protein BT96DRAFT_946801 [Gymnopus androsaceus JB14]
MLKSYIGFISGESIGYDNANREGEPKQGLTQACLAGCEQDSGDKVFPLPSTTPPHIQAFSESSTDKIFTADFSRRLNRVQVRRFVKSFSILSHTKHSQEAAPG